MPSITLNATDTQVARLTEAVDSFNAQQERTLSTKEWIYFVLRQAVTAQLMVQPAQDATAAVSALRASIASDMAGGS